MKRRILNFNNLRRLFFSAKRLSDVLSSPRQSLRNAAENSFKKVLPGVVVTSSRSSRRRISSAAATQAFAVATSGESPKGIRTERLASNQGKLFPKKYFLLLIIIHSNKRCWFYIISIDNT